MSDQIARALGLPIQPDDDQPAIEAEIVDGAVTPRSDPPVAATVDPHTAELLADVDKAKQNIIDLADSAKDTVDTLMKLAKDSQSARMFEVLATVIKTAVDANKDVVAMSKERHYLNTETPAAQNTTNVTNNTLILSTTELLAALQQKNK